MVKEVQYTNIRRVLDDLTDHPMLRDLTLEQVVRYTVRFMGLHGFSKFYQDKVDKVEIDQFRGVLPCDLISIIQVKDIKSGVCLRSMTDTFLPDRRTGCWELSFKTQGNIIYTSFPKGCVEIAYKSIPVDEDGFPMVIDNENYLAALEAYIKKQVFIIKFDQGKISPAVMQQANYTYGDLSAQLNSEFLIPSYSEMESITRYYNSLIPSVRHFETSFKSLGDREYIRRH